ncbi:hypothetical protein LY78DRAFT_58637 [Colletotrichum sublineola]|nr:hypothetical protein LY78DRAFT_58637 [Colletotrichum sublineola]
MLAGWSNQTWPRRLEKRQSPITSALLGSPGQRLSCDHLSRSPDMTADRASRLSIEDAQIYLLEADCRTRENPTSVAAVLGTRSRGYFDPSSSEPGCWPQPRGLTYLDGRKGRCTWSVHPSSSWSSSDLPSGRPRLQRDRRHLVHIQEARTSKLLLI